VAPQWRACSRTGGTRSSSPISWVTSLRLAAVSGPGERQAAAVYEEVLAARAAAVDRAGTGFRAPFSPAGTSSRPLRATIRADRPRATRRATTRAASPRSRPAARRATCARRSSRNRSRTPAAGAPSRSPCAARTRSLQRQAIVERLPTRIAKTTRSVRQQRQDPLPERIRDLPRLRRIDILPSLTTEADGLRYRRTGPFIQLELLRASAGSWPGPAAIAATAASSAATQLVAPSQPAQVPTCVAGAGRPRTLPACARWLVAPDHGRRAGARGLGRGRPGPAPPGRKGSPSRRTSRCPSERPYHERLGFRYLATKEERPALRAIRDHERGSGLDARRARV
jgi:hypothetical protein